VISLSQSQSREVNKDPQLAVAVANDAQHFWPNVLVHLTMLHGAVPDTLLPGSGVALLPPAFFAGAAAILSLLDSLDLTPQLGNITAQTVVIGGEHDRVFPPEHSRAIADAIPNARLVIVPDTGHGLLFECAERVIELL